MALPDLPPSLKSIKAYIEQGKLRASDPIVSYYCNLYALQEAMAMRSKIPKSDMAFILALMDHVEAQKQTLGDSDAASMQVQVENTAAELFQNADDADRGGNHGLQVAKDFLAAANIFEVCKQFMGDDGLPEDMAEKSKYGKWRFVELCKAAKERRAPAPPRGMDEGEAADSSSARAETSPDGSIPPVRPPHSALPGGTPPMEMHHPGKGPPPSYMDLPPSAPGGVPPAAYPPQIGHQPPSFDVTQVPSVPSVPQTPQDPQAYGGYASPPSMPQYLAPAIVNPAFQPSRAAIGQAMGLCKSAQDSLAFQDHITAINSLQQAIAHLMQPPAQSPP